MRANAKGTYPYLLSTRNCLAPKLIFVFVCVRVRVFCTTCLSEEGQVLYIPLLNPTCTCKVFFFKDVRCCKQPKRHDLLMQCARAGRAPRARAAAHARHPLLPRRAQVPRWHPHHPAHQARHVHPHQRHAARGTHLLHKGLNFFFCFCMCLSATLSDLRKSRATTSSPKTARRTRSRLCSATSSRPTATSSSQPPPSSTRSRSLSPERSEACATTSPSSSSLQPTGQGRSLSQSERLPAADGGGQEAVLLPPPALILQPRNEKRVIFLG